MNSVDKPQEISHRSHLAVLDAHCHVDLYPDPKAVVAEAESRGIYTVAVTNAPSVFSFTRDLTSQCRYVRPAIGLHPELVTTRGHELDRFWPFLKDTRYVGEVGLDYVTNDPTNRAKQREVFSAIIERCSAMGGKILTIHSRRAAADVISIMGRDFPGKAILHWFSGTPKQVNQAATAGFFFSINPSMLSSKKGQALAESMPRDRILTETDGPFVKLGSRPATPADTALVVAGLADIWRVTPEEARELVTANLRRLVVYDG